MRNGKLVKANGAIPDRHDDSYIYSLTKNGFRLVQKYLDISLTSSRIKSDSEEHDLDLLDIRNIFLRKKIVHDYYAENQIQSYINFNEDSDLNLFQRLRFDALAFCKRGEKEAYFGIQYERSRKNQNIIKRIMTDYYTESSLSFVLYVCENNIIETQLKKAELEVSKESDKKLYFIQFDDLKNADKVLKFKNQNNEILQIN
jgi:hypothetical protein